MYAAAFSDASNVKKKFTGTGGIAQQPTKPIGTIGGCCCSKFKCFKVQASSSKW
jgi:hypothetical protein